ncbi:UDP-N-acetylglucosamine acyltransferase [Haloechinothrix sp. YIM 98757]|uniref:UDP-N-acetylglucosamine acyltransferase n=1 Tax=Haloechinothrix aidingensis TaxID=2752311 RepID=A0A838A3T2_9PSEU|nr:UDP-N-acetylglucosamine acyltransferase [Haloechinothrix aidingensis]
MSNHIHDTAVIADGVELGDGNVVGPYAVLLGPAVIGDHNWIGPHVTIGAPASDAAAPHPRVWEHGPAGDPELDGYGVAIGDGNRIREYASVHQGTWRTTRLGSEGYYLRGVHVAHDCVVGDGVVLGSNTVLGGHCEVWSEANLGLGVLAHQRARVGPGAMVGMGAVVLREVGPFAVSAGVPARFTGINTVGLTRAGLGEEEIATLRPYLLGERALPDGGVPAGVAARLTAWDSRTERGQR